jgi:hypothetical protein
VSRLDSLQNEHDSLKHDHERLFARDTANLNRLIECQGRLKHCRCGAGDTREHKPGCALPWFHEGDCSDQEPPNLPDMFAAPSAPSEGEKP